MAPDDTTTREYVQVVPTTDPPSPRQLHHGLTQLHTTHPAPTYECLLTSPPDAQRVDYRLGTTGDIARLDRALDTLLPTTYERTTHTTSLQAALETPDLADRDAAAWELVADPNHPQDWQLPLTDASAFHHPDDADDATWPLASVIATLADADAPIACQLLFQPKPDWTPTRDLHRQALRTTRDGTVLDELIDALTNTRPQERETPALDELPPATQRRIEELDAVDPAHTYTVNARAVAVQHADAGEPTNALTGLGDAFAPIGTAHYGLDARTHAPGTDAAARIRDDLTARRVHTTDPATRIPEWCPYLGPRANATGPDIVAQPTTAGAFCAVGGESLPEPARRAIHTKPQDSVPRPLPPQAVLDRYRQPGFRVGLATTTNDTTEPGALATSPAQQIHHTVLAGKTGAGKSMHAAHALAVNHAVTDGATVLLEPKDGQFADAYERIHYAEYGSLEAVYRFDAHTHLPAAPVLDIGAALESGLSRAQAIQAVTHRLEALLRGVMGTEAYEQAFTASRVITLTARALFDARHGDEQVSLQELQATLSRMHHQEQAPPVSSDALRRELGDLLANSQDTFTEIVRGAARRLAELAGHEQLAAQLNYVPRPDGDRWDWREMLDEDCVVILDTSQLEPESQRVVTLLTLSQLWTALRRRQRERRRATATGDPPVVNVHVEEAPDVAAASLLDDFLAKGRSFGAAVSLTLQFPGQFEGVDRDVYKEVINNTGTVLAGEVSRDPALAETLATSEVPPSAVANRLRALADHEWLCRLPSDGDASRPFTVASGPLPPGIEGGPEPLTEAEETTLRAARLRMRERSHDHAVAVGGDTTTDHDSQSSDPEPADTGRMLDTTGPMTTVAPEGVTFDATRRSWTCTTCETHFGADLDALLDAATCYRDGDRSAIDRAMVPTVQVDCSLTPAERAATGYSDAQLTFMQLLYNVWRGRFDPRWEYDRVWDDMDRLCAYAGIDAAERAELATDGLVVQDTTRPHTVYSLTPDGRQLLDAPHREGVAHGDGQGDLSESNAHRMGVEATARFLETAYADDPTEPGHEVARYHGVGDGRLDVAVLDRAGVPVVTAEVERSNNDTLRAAPADYDLMAACDPTAAIWVVPDRETGHEVIRALANPADGEPRVAKSYDDSTYLPRVTIDQPGFTDIYGLETLRNQFLATPDWVEG